MANKAQIKALEERLRIAEQISEARKEVLEGVLSTIDSVFEQLVPEFFTEEEYKDIGRAIRAVKAGRTPNGNREVEVAIGTPLCCDPTSETYWSM